MGSACARTFHEMKHSDSNLLATLTASEKKKQQMVETTCDPSCIGFHVTCLACRDHLTPAEFCAKYSPSSEYVPGCSSALIDYLEAHTEVVNKAIPSHPGNQGAHEMQVGKETKEFFSTL